MYLQTQFSIFLVNKPGVLAAITEALAKADVNIIALTLVDSLEHGVLRIVCDKAQAAREVLKKTHDRWTETDVLVIELGNEPGAFAKVSSRLADEHINISYAYCTASPEASIATAVFKVADMNKARKLLGDTPEGEKGPPEPRQ
jgi:hypothetical protein